MGPGDGCRSDTGSETVAGTNFWKYSFSQYGIHSQIQCIANNYFIHHENNYVYGSIDRETLMLPNTWNGGRPIQLKWAKVLLEELD